jgi:hypothetical protein
MNNQGQTKKEGGGAVASGNLLASRLRKCEWLDDWYVVDGSLAQPEGTAAEWRMVMDAMRRKRSERPGRRIGVTVYDDGRVKFYSPRNCAGPDDVVRVAANEAAAWLASAEVLLANPLGGR